MEFMLWIWVAIIAVTAIAEFISVQMISIWFTVGGFAAIIAYACTAPYWAQIIVFVIISAICLLCFRKAALKWLLKNVKERTNADAIIGKTVMLLTDVTQDNEGEAKINDVVWSVTAKDGGELKAGTHVTIVAIDGNKLIAVEADNKTE